VCLNQDGTLVCRQSPPLLYPRLNAVKQVAFDLLGCSCPTLVQQHGTHGNRRSSGTSLVPFYSSPSSKRNGGVLPLTISLAYQQAPTPIYSSRFCSLLDLACSFSPSKGFDGDSIFNGVCSMVVLKELPAELHQQQRRQHRRDLHVESMTNLASWNSPTTSARARTGPTGVEKSPERHQCNLRVMSMGAQQTRCNRWPRPVPSNTGESVCRQNANQWSINATTIAMGEHQC